MSIIYMKEGKNITWMYTYKKGHKEAYTLTMRTREKNDTHAKEKGKERTKIN